MKTKALKTFTVFCPKCGKKLRLKNQSNVRDAKEGSIAHRPNVHLCGSKKAILGTAGYAFGNVQYLSVHVKPLTEAE